VRVEHIYSLLEHIREGCGPPIHESLHLSAPPEHRDRKIWRPNRRAYACPMGEFPIERANLVSHQG
jgi:hypothetical protein